MTESTPSERQYLRVTTLDHAGHRARRDIEVTSDDERFLVGTELDREGSRTSRVHVIDQAAIVQRVALRWNNHYGELEVAR